MAADRKKPPVRCQMLFGAGPVAEALLLLQELTEGRIPSPVSLQQPKHSKGD